MSITPEDLAAIQRRQRIAEALMQQGQQPLETNQVAGGYVVPVSPLAGLSKIIQSMSGAYMGKKADERKAAMEREQQAAVTGIDFNSPDAPQKLIAAGRFEDGLKLAIEQQKEAKKVHREGIPSGFDKTADGSIKPMPVEGYGDYANFLLQQAGAKKQQLGPFDEEKMDMSRDDQAMQHQSLSIAQQNAEIARRRFEMDQAKGNEPKPMSEFQQWNIQQKEEAKLSELDNARASIDETIGDFNALKDIQKVTTTGPLSGNPVVAAIRKMGPNSITGGENLQRLEKGYNTLAVKAIGAFKAGGVTFGQLSNKEGEWIRSTQQAIDTGGNINLEMLEKGINLLNERKARVEKRLSNFNPTINQAPETEYTPVSNFRLSGKAANMPAEKKAIVERVLQSGTEEEKVKLLNKGWLEESQ